MSRVFAMIGDTGLALGICLMGLAGAVCAGVICVPYPEKTAADALIDSATVVLAREHPYKPFSYAPVGTLKGYADGAEIGLLLDSTTRRILAVQPERAVVLVRKREEEPWRSLGLADADQEFSGPTNP
jgi:hypothetical protein